MKRKLPLSIICHSTLLLLFFLPLSTFAAKSSYKITFVAEGNKDSMLYMGYYLAQYRYFCDSAVNNGKGKFVFEGDHELDPGLYISPTIATVSSNLSYTMKNNATPLAPTTTTGASA